jgi:hypothetical protein
VHRQVRRLAALLTLAVPVLLIGRAGATWGAAPAATVPARAPHPFETSPLAIERDEVERTESAVVLVVLDGVRWQEVFGGADRAIAHQHGLDHPPWASARALMPNLHRALDRGDAVAIGANDRGPQIAASGPQFISMPGYLEIFAGKPDRGCYTNACDRPPERTIADDVRDQSGPDDVAVICSWPNIARAASAGPSGFVVSAGRKRMEREDALRADAKTASLLDEGAGAAPFPGEGDYRPDRYTARVALRHLETARPRFLFVGLGDADEYGHRNDYRRYLEALHASDAFLGDLAATLARMGARGRHTTVLVTTDHGRAYDFRDHGPTHPESGRVWLLAEGDDVRGRAASAGAGAESGSREQVRYTLSNVAPTVRALLGIAGGDGEAVGGQPIAEIAGR